MMSVLERLPDKLSDLILNKYSDANEIALRSGRKVAIKIHNNYHSIDYVTTNSDMKDILQKMCEMSVYAYLDELQNGFITLNGGHRVGVCGTAVYKDNRLKNIKNVSSLNIRIAKEYIGCSDRLKIHVKNLLIISPPGCGKTTLVRDLCRKLSKLNKVSVIDERGEIAGMNKGMASFDIGEMTDVMSLCDKRTGIEMVLRSMSPDYIITDEIAEKDCDSIKKAMTYGVYIVATAHGDDIDKTVGRIGVNKNMFENIILLNNHGRIGNIDKIYGGQIYD